MSPIDLATQLDAAAILPMFRKAKVMAGWEVWKRRIESLEAEFRANPLSQEYLLRKYSLEMAFLDIDRHFHKTSRIPWPCRTADEYRLYSFLGTLTQVSDQVSQSGKNKLQGALRSALEKDFGLGPLAFEMKVLAHLVSRGFRVELNDLENNGGFDFLAILGPLELEVECKHLSADIGRQIPRHCLHLLGGELLPVLRRHSELAHEGHLVRVILPGKLTKNMDQQKVIARYIDEVLSGKAGSFNDDACIASKRSLQLDVFPLHTMHARNETIQNIRKTLMNRYDVYDQNMLFFLTPSHPPIVICFGTEQADRVLENMTRRLLDDAKRQFSGRRPAMLCAHLAEITENELQILANAKKGNDLKGFRLMAELLWTRRPHLHSVAIMADGEVEIVKTHSHSGGGISIHETGPSLFYRNPNHPLARECSLNQVFHDN